MDDKQEAVCNKLTQKDRIEAYKDGKVLHNHSRGEKETTTFKFMGNMYTTNTQRRNKYSFDDSGWMIITTSWWYKFGQVYLGKVHKLRDCKKSLDEGIK